QGARGADRPDEPQPHRRAGADRRRGEGTRRPDEAHLADARPRAEGDRRGAEGTRGAQEADGAQPRRRRRRDRRGAEGTGAAEGADGTRADRHEGDRRRGEGVRRGAAEVPDREVTSSLPTTGAIMRNATRGVLLSFGLFALAPPARADDAEDRAVKFV